MYDNLLDRARIIQILFKAWRLAKKSKQADLASASKIRQSVISNIENLSSTLNDKKRQVSRDDLINATLVLAEGKEKLDLLLWLFDGNFLESEEESKFGLKDEERKKSAHRKKPREAVLELLKEALDIYEKNNPSSPAEVIGHRGNYGEEKYFNKRFRVGDELLKMEMVEGARLLVRPRPSFLILKNLDLDKDGEVTIKQRPYEIGMERIRLFFSRISEFGERCIHEESAILQYLETADSADELSKRKKQIEALIKLLNEYEKFQIRLAENIPPFNFQVTGLNTVFLSSRQYMGKDEKEKYEDSYIKRIKLSGERNVLPFIIEFETYWNKLSAKQSNADVIDILKNMLKKV